MSGVRTGLATPKGTTEMLEENRVDCASGGTSLNPASVSFRCVAAGVLAEDVPEIDPHVGARSSPHRRRSAPFVFVSSAGPRISATSRKPV